MERDLAPGRRPWPRISLTHQILIGLLAGVLIGWLLPSVGVALKPVGQLFLRLIKMIVGPLILTTLVAGLAGAGAKVVGRVGLKALLWFEAATTVALFVGLGVANLVRPGDGVGLAPDPGAAGKLGQAKGAVQFILEAFPVSIFDALARNDILQVVVFSVFIGLAAGSAGEKGVFIKRLAESGAEVMFKVVGFVMRFAPLGVGAAMAATLGAKGIGVLVPLAKVVGSLYLALGVFLALLMLSVRAFTRVNVRTLLSSIREPAVVAFTTTSSEAAMPRAMEIMERLGVPRSIVSFVMPAGYSFNLDGSTLYLSLAVMFVAQAAGVELAPGQQLAIMGMLMVTTKGVAGVPRSALVVLAGALTAFHLPLEGVAILLAIDELMDMGRSSVNVVGNCVACAVVGSWEGVIPEDAPVLRPRTAGSAAPIA